MEIESIPEVESENEAENVCSQIDLQFHRMQTEFEDDEQAYDLYLIEELFNRYLLFAVCLIATGGLIQLARQHWISNYFCVLPLMLMELKCLFEFSIKFIREVQVLSVFWKSEFFNESISSLGNICCYLIIATYLSGYVNCLIFACPPLLAATIFKTIIKVSASNACISFVSLLKSFVKWFCILQVALVSLQIDGIFEVKWSTVFIPLLLMIFIGLVVSLGAIILIVLNLCSKEKDWLALFSHLWLFYTVFLGCSIIAILIYFFITKGTISLIPPVVYLIVFIIFTYLMKKSLAIWWWDFFITDSLLQLHSNCPDSPLPLPISHSLQIDGSFTNKLSKVIKFTPKAILKLVKPSIQTSSEKRERKKMNRTLSQSIEISAKSFHARSRSTISHNYCIDADQKTSESLCRVCNRESTDGYFEKCGHGGICFRCGEIVMKTKKVCDICHSDIESVMKKKAEKGNQKSFENDDFTNSN